MPWMLQTNLGKTPGTWWKLDFKDALTHEPDEKKPWVFMDNPGFLMGLPRIFWKGKWMGLFINQQRELGYLCYKPTNRES